MTSGLNNDFVARLIAFGPHDGAHRVAVRACVSIVVPLLVVQATGHAPWTIYAAFGAFTSLYGRERVDRSRLLLQAEAGLVQVACVVLGVLVGTSDQRAWLAVPIAAIVATLAAARSSFAGWHPPGSLFQIFAFASVASVPSHLGDVGTGAAVAGASAAFAVLVGAVGSLQRRVRGYGVVSMNRPIGGALEGVWPYALQAGVGVLVAGAIATGVGIGRPYWAMVAAVVPLAARNLTAQLVRGLHRIVGTGLGLLVAWALLALDIRGIALVAVIAVLQAAAELLVGRNYALALVWVTPLALLMVHAAAPVPTDQLLADRGLETLIGAVIGIVIGYLTRPRLRF
ncbi:FUSC family protein [Nocardioides sp. DS6]|uniref:FUSC family protein n=1 Tax=Nocardioides eburneus TaxID=3231482 RepID=A0ABV3SXY2_9ACTN